MLQTELQEGIGVQDRGLIHGEARKMRGTRTPRGAHKTHELRNRILFTVLVVTVYMSCQGIALYGVAVDEASLQGPSVQHFLSMLIAGDRYRVSVMALGIAPYINASLLVQIVFALRSSAARAKVSKIQNERWMRVLSVVFALSMAVAHALMLSYREDAGPLWAVRLAAAAAMFAGAMLTCFLCVRNERYGVGASMPLIFVSIATQLAQTVGAHRLVDLWVIAALCLAVAVGTAFMENSLIRIPLQRVSIHNVHADQNYLAYKRAPMGIMPVMFAASAFLLPHALVTLLAMAFPQSAALARASQDMVLTRPLGAGVYLALILVLAVLFSLLMLNPKEAAHQLQRNGDSVVGMYPGRQTRRYLTGIVLRWSLVSGLLQAGCMAVSLALAAHGSIPTTMAMVPATTMILVSIVCSLAHEVATYYRYDAYRFFL